jgi:hypothetical protein
MGKRKSVQKTAPKKSSPGSKDDLFASMRFSTKVIFPPANAKAFPTGRPAASQGAAQPNPVSVGTLPNGYVRASPLPRLTNTRVPREQITSTPSTCKPAGHTGRMSVRIHRPVATWPHNNSIAFRANHSLGNRSNRL